MPTYFFTWNAKSKLNWKTFKSDLIAVRKGELVAMNWSCGNTKRIITGDRFFLLRLGVEDRGVIGAGLVISDVQQRAHWRISGRRANYHAIQFDSLLDPETEGVLSERKLLDIAPLSFWRPQPSGVLVPENIAQPLEERWAEHLESLGVVPPAIADEIGLSADDYAASEGRVCLVRHLRRERSRALVEKKKAKVLRDVGRLACEICSFDFSKAYGGAGSGIIECHHTKPMHTLKREQITRLGDLILVCPNCHRVLHKGMGVTVGELTRLVRARRRRR